MADTKKTGQQDKPDKKLGVEKTELDAEELDDISGGWQKDYESGFGTALTPRKKKTPGDTSSS